MAEVALDETGHMIDSEIYTCCLRRIENFRARFDTRAPAEGAMANNQPDCNADDFAILTRSASGDSITGHPSFPEIIVAVLQITACLDKEQRQAETVNLKLDCMHQEIVVTRQRIVDWMSRSPEDADTGPLEYDFVRAAEIGLTCTDDLVRIGVLPTDYETSTIMPLGAEAALMWHDILHITFEQLLSTIHFLNRIRLRQDFFDSGHLKDILAAIDPYTANQARKAYFVLLGISCEVLSQGVLDLILHWKRMQSMTPAIAV